MISQVFRWASAATIAIVLAWVANSQSTSVICPDSMKWANNVKNQNPCLMSAYTYQPCQGSFIIPPIPNGDEYAGPVNSTAADPCLCNTVTYSLFAACSACQNASFSSWSEWKSECSESVIGINTYPPGVPNSTVFPSWAYLPISGDIWNETLAEANALSVQSNVPLSTASAPATSVSVHSSPSSDPTASSASHTNIGAIAGGVVGAVIGLALIAGAAFICLRRRKGVTGKQKNLIEKEKNSAQTDLVASPPPYQAPMSPEMPMKLYDPDDPSTYPTSPPASELFSPTSAGHYKPHHSPQTSTDSSSTAYTEKPKKGYTGAAEV